ncbi:MAG: energy-coupling factor transporter transmembrane protein EcfT [Chloroflexi bacterium]|nr:MAG: energy-coupling factor transporter transmembrane protein EcfT [Chloroflexota bacterium]TME18232.1 MAG: energy-coupling factor transporter transmembrane protein EcfT [Chloroflexota bacterium]TME20123.1 MAG: energy-coupling factor transporter transmembrane protein EcfT [Chloroflexota bacterium]
MKAIYQYSGISTPIHKLDPRTKLVMTLCYLLVSFILPSPLRVGPAVIPVPFVMAMLIVLAIWAVLRVRPWDYMMLWVYLIPIVGGITFAHVFFLDGPPFARIPGIPFHHLSIRGFFFGLDIGFRIVAMGFAFVLFSMTTDPFHWGLAMFKAGVPYKGAFMFAFGMRFYPLLQEEYFVIRDALKARGSDLLTSMNPVKLMNGVAVSAIPLGLGALRRSQNIALAMELRGFSFPEETGVPRVLYRDVRMRRVDWIVVGAFVLMLLVSLVLRLTGTIQQAKF